MPSPPELATKLEPVVLQAVRSVGFDLEQLDVQQAGRRRVLRVIVDSDEGVGLDEVAEASRALAAALDERDDLLGGPYTLEVTSPGVERPLTKPRHWRRARLRLVKARLTEGRELLGRVGPAHDDRVVLLVDGALRELPYAEVERAVVEVEFKQPPADELARLAEQPATPESGSDQPGRTIATGETKPNTEEESK